MNRSECVKEIMGQLNEDDILISSTGYISREAYKYDRPLNFYMQGSMGNALAIGIGIAMNIKNRVFVLNGDGSSLMNLGTMVTARALCLDNLFNFILDNKCHESTGGQKTNSSFINFAQLNKNTMVFDIERDDSIPPRIDIPNKFIAERFKNAISDLCNKQI